MSSSAPAVIDWLVANHPTAVGADVWTVSDGWPTAIPPRLVIIGSLTTASADQTSQVAFLGTQAIVLTGGKSRFEDYTVTVEYRALGGGTDQKTLRDAVYAAKGALEALINADWTLGGLVDGCAAEMNADTLQQTDEAGAPNGRFATLTTAFRVRNTY